MIYVTSHVQYNTAHVPESSMITVNFMKTSLMSEKDSFFLNEPVWNKDTGTNTACIRIIKYLN